MLAWAAAAVSLTLLAVGMIAFFADTGQGPTVTEDVLDKRASVVSMFTGIGGLLLSAVTLWAQFRASVPAQPDASSASDGPSSSGQSSPVVGTMSGGRVVGQVSGQARVSGPGSTSVEGERAISVGGDAQAPVMSGNHATAITGFTQTAGQRAMMVGGDFTGMLLAGDVLPERPSLPPVDAVREPLGLVGLPRRPVSGFVGREQALDGVRCTLATGEGLGVISQAVVGLGGVGKSELALQYAHRHGGGYRLVWWIDAESPARIQAELGALTRALVAGVDAAAAGQATAEEAAAWALAWLSAHRDWLVVFDNVEQSADVEPYLGRLTHGHVLITTRRDIGWQRLGVAPLRLALLARPASIALLAGLLDPSESRRERLLDELAEQLGDLPLALAQAGAYIARTPRTTVRGYLRSLEDIPNRMLAAGAAGDDSARVVAKVWTLSYQRISAIDPLAAWVLNLLAFYAPDNLPCTVLDGLDDVDGRRDGGLAVREALALLASYSLVTLTTAPGDDDADEPVDLIGVHRLVQATTKAQLTGDLPQAVRRQAAELLQAALPEIPEDPDNWPTYHLLTPHARAVLPADSLGLEQVCAYLAASGDYHTAVDIQRWIHAHHLQTSGPEDPKTLTARSRLAYRVGEAGDAEGARSQFAALLPIYERVFGPEDPNTLTARSNLATSTGKTGDAEGARNQLAALLPVLERVFGPEDPNTLTARSNLATSTGEAGDAEGARSQFAALLPIYERVFGPEDRNTLTTRSNLATWTWETGDAEGTRSQLAALLPVLERVFGPEDPNTLTARSNLATSTGKTGDAEGARSQFAALLPIYERVFGPEDPNTLAVRSNLATSTGEAGDAEGARSQFAALLPVLERVFGPEDPNTLAVRSSLAYWRSGTSDR
ncbi:tetratricopeptide repeat protein [Nonomuraea longicatena]|uniref:NB-ARC domain-containing protein n=1 Tax=Nonomuraea longicatena TaxID=83682 RepID=A0ABN1R1V6_9ACTN